MGWPAIVLVLLLLLLLAAAAVFALRPLGLAEIVSRPRPSSGYAESVQRVAALQAQEAEGYHPGCVTVLLTHGGKTARVVVLVHGYTNCPQQFIPLGRQFYDRGYNVLIARMPRAGRADRMSAEHGGLTALEMAAHADEVVDIATGLGERIVMAGLSGGGTTTAWAAQHRAEVDRAMLIAPAFGYVQVPAALTVAAMNAALGLLPNFFVWWDPALKETSGPPHTYPRLSSRAVMSVLRLAFATRAHAGRHPPAARSIVLVTNANDDKVDNAAARRMAQAWRASGAADVTVYEFPAELKLHHDLIDPSEPDAHPEVVYPKLIELMGEV
jgi:alpha-beta hydrolase superfamily lysophospholipase